MSSEYVVYILNRTAVRSLNNRTPYEKLFGETPDVSMIIQMPYQQLIAFKNEKQSFPQDPAECVGYFIGFAESVGHLNTFKVLDMKTGKIKYRSRV